MTETAKSTSNHVETVEDEQALDRKHVEKQRQVGSLPSAVDPALEKKVIRNIDLLVVPFICITYLITYIDKAMLGYSAVFGLKESLNLHASAYSWVGSMFYFGYLAFEYPTPNAGVEPTRNGILLKKKDHLPRFLHSSPSCSRSNSSPIGIP